MNTPNQNLEQNNSPLLDYQDLKETAKKIFEGRPFVSYNEYIEKLIAFYEGSIDEPKEGQDYHHGMMTVKALQAIQRRLNNRFREPKKMAIVGIGPGELVEVYLEMAKKMEVEHISFNDLVPAHIKVLREKIKSLYGGQGDKVDGTSLSYQAGSFLKTDFPGDYHLAVFDGTTSSEIFDPSGVHATEKLRNDLYRKIRAILVHNGMLYETMPNNNEYNKSLYYQLTDRSVQVFKSVGALPRTEERFMLRNWIDQKGNPFPHQLVYAPESWREDDRRKKHNLQLVEHDIISLPESSQGTAQDVVNILRRHTSINGVVADLQNTALRVSKYVGVNDSVQLRSVVSMKV